MKQTALQKPQRSRFSGLTLGKVSQIYPEANMVDLLLFDGSVLPRVQVMVNFASSRTGDVGLPFPSYEKNMLERDIPLAEAKSDESDVIAVIGHLGAGGDALLRPVVLGFLFPENCELLCPRDQIGNKDGTMKLWKHESNVYVRVAKGDTIDKPSDIEISHPSGLLIKIGDYDGDKTPDQQRTPIVNFDSKNNIRTFNPLNPVTGKADPAPNVHIYHPSGTYLTVNSLGDVAIVVVGDVTKTVKKDENGDRGNVTEIIEGDLDRTVNGDVTETLKGKVTREITGDVSETLKAKLTKEVDGDITETLKGNVDKTVSGHETDFVEGAFQRSSDTSITDTAPSIHHD